MAYGNSAFASSAGGGGTVTLVVPDGAKLFAIAIDPVESPAETFTFPSGFTALTPQILNTGLDASVACMQIAWKDASSESGSYAISWAHGGQPGAFGVFYFTGRAAGSGAITFQDTQGPAASHSGTPVSVPLTGLTAPSGADIVWIPALCQDGAGTITFTAPSGYTVHGSQSDGSRAIGLASKDGGGTGAATGTLTGSVSGAGGDTMGIVLALASGAVIVQSPGPMSGGFRSMSGGMRG